MNDQTQAVMGADVLGFENGDVEITGTDAGFAVRSLVRGKGVENDWIKTEFN